MGKINAATSDAYEKAVTDLRNKIAEQKAIASSDDRWKWELRESCLIDILSETAPNYPGYVQKVADGSGDTVSGVLAKVGKRSIGN